MGFCLCTFRRTLMRWRPLVCRTPRARWGATLEDSCLGAAVFWPPHGSSKWFSPPNKALMAVASRLPAFLHPGGSASPRAGRWAWRTPLSASQMFWQRFWKQWWVKNHESDCFLWDRTDFFRASTAHTWCFRINATLQLPSWHLKLYFFFF